MIGFAGLSHLGLVSGIAAAAKSGEPVRAYDPDPSLCEQLRRGSLPFVEPDLDALMARYNDQLQFDTDPTGLAECDVIYLAMDVPTDSEGNSELAPVRELVERVAGVASPGTVLVVLSQVPPGFTRQLSIEIDSLATRQLQLFYQVETLIFGQAVERALYPERIIVGRLGLETGVPTAYRRFLERFNCPVLVMRCESAELTKIAINVFLVSSVSTTNMLAGICEATGAEWSEIVPGLRLDRRIGEHAYLAPGLGIGGSNLVRDLSTLQHIAAEAGADVDLVRQWLELSRFRRDWALRVLHREVMAKLVNPVVSVWGLTYKPNTGSMVNSPALHLLESLVDCSIRAYDPVARLDPARYPDVVSCLNPIDAACDADVVLVMTAWDEFGRVDVGQLSAAMRGRVIVDPFGVLARAGCDMGKLDYYRLGSQCKGSSTAC